MRKPKPHTSKPIDPINITNELLSLALKRPRLTASPEAKAAHARKVDEARAEADRKAKEQSERLNKAAGATKERLRHARHGVDVQPTTADSSGPHRAVIRSPVTLPDQLVANIAARLAHRKEKAAYVEPALSMTYLDQAFAADRDGGILRGAIGLLIKDISATMERNVSPNGIFSAKWDKTPLTEEQRQAFKRIAFLRAHLDPREKQDLIALASMILPGEGSAPTEASYGYRRAHQTNAYGEVDKLAEMRNVGAFLGVMIRLSERLHDLYRVQKLPWHIMHLQEIEGELAGNSQISKNKNREKTDA